MKSRAARGIAFRIRAAFMLFALAAAVLFAVVGYVLFHLTEDLVLADELAQETERARRSYVQGRPPLAEPFAEVFVDAHALPVELRTISSLPPGAHEIDVPNGERFVSITPLPDGHVLFVVHDRHGERPVARIVGPVLAIGALLLLAGGIALSGSVSRRIVRPLQDLARSVERAPAEGLVDVLPSDGVDVEVRVLADRLRDAIHALAASTQREERFLRDASHELRTPLTVVRGAAELLRALPEAAEPRVDRPLARIERAVIDMQSTVEVLLRLARGRVESDASQPTAVVPVVRRVFEREREGARTGVDTVLVIDAEPYVSVPEAAIAIVVGNLLANAVRFTEQGQIAVTVLKDGLCVTDSGIGLTADEVAAATRPFARSESSAGYGVGLAIVASLCERFDWTFRIESTPAVGTKVSVVFVENS